MSGNVTWPALTALLAALGLLVAAFTAWVHEKKLRFDLFVRRFDAYEAVNRAISDRVREIQADKTTSDNAPVIDELRKFWEARRPMRHLFPSEIDSLLAAIETRLGELASEHAAMAEFRSVRGGTGPAFREVYGRYMAALNDVTRMQDVLATMVGPHLRQETAFEGIARLIGSVGPRRLG